MTDLVLHDTTRQQFASFVRRPSHAVLLIGAAGVGKGALALQLAERLLELPAGNIQNYAHLHHIASPDNKSIGIEAVRELEHITSLKVPGKKTVARVVLLENAHLLTIEAQNALLKTLEEPPADTVLILTAAHEQALLPTIRSRLQILPVYKPDATMLAKYFAGTIDEATLNQSLLISGGLPGLLASLLDNASEHPLKEAVAVARDILQKTPYERLKLVDELVKHKDLCRDVCTILVQMSEMAMKRTEGSVFRRWQQVLSTAYNANRQLSMNSLPKLVLTNLMLGL